jgi:hypothetical protein
MMESKSSKTQESSKKSNEYNAVENETEGVTPKGYNPGTGNPPVCPKEGCPSTIRFC